MTVSARVSIRALENGGGRGAHLTRAAVDALLCGSILQSADVVIVIIHQTVHHLRIFLQAKGVSNRPDTTCSGLAAYQLSVAVTSAFLLPSGLRGSILQSADVVVSCVRHSCRVRPEAYAVVIVVARQLLLRLRLLGGHASGLGLATRCVHPQLLLALTLKIGLSALLRTYGAR